MNGRFAALLGASAILLGACTGERTAPSPKPSPVPPTASPAPTQSPSRRAIVLGARGLGIVELGAAPDDVVAAVTRELGKPDEDTGLITDPQSRFGVCPGGRVRGARWRTLWTLFSDGETGWAPAGRMHFFHYFDSEATAEADKARPLGLKTAEGIGVGATVRHLKDAYGGRLEHTEDEIFGARWRLRVTEPEFLGGSLSSRSDSGIARTVEGGIGCGE